MTSLPALSLCEHLYPSALCVGERFLFPVRLSSPDGVDVQLHTGAHGASWVPQRISSCMPRPVDSASPPHPRLLRMLLCCLRRALKPSTTGLSVSKLYQHFRARDCPCGLQDSLCTLTSLFVHGLLHFLIEINTRYGWVAKPFPDGDLHPVRYAGLRPSAITPGSPVIDTRHWFCAERGFTPRVNFPRAADG